jgi:hypothetical protein
MVSVSRVLVARMFSVGSVVVSRMISVGRVPVPRMFSVGSAVVSRMISVGSVPVSHIFSVQSARNFLSYDRALFMQDFLYLHFLQHRSTSV